MQNDCSKFQINQSADDWFYQSGCKMCAAKLYVRKNTFKNAVTIHVWHQFLTTYCGANRRHLSCRWFVYSWWPIRLEPIERAFFFVDKISIKMSCWIENVLIKIEGLLEEVYEVINFVLRRKRPDREKRSRDDSFVWFIGLDYIVQLDYWLTVDYWNWNLDNTVAA